MSEEQHSDNEDLQDRPQQPDPTGPAPQPDRPQQPWPPQQQPPQRPQVPQGSGDQGPRDGDRKDQGGILGFFSSQQPQQPLQTSTAFKWGWGLLGFFFGILSLLLVFVGTMRKPTAVRLEAFRYACYGFLAAILFELLLMVLLGPEFISSLGFGGKAASTTGSAF